MNTGDPFIDHNADTHIGFHDSTGDPGVQKGIPGHYAVAKLPDINLGPVPTCSVFYPGIQRAHMELNAWKAAGGVSPVPVVITGVGFFDGDTGQSDQALNHIQLRSVLDLNINPGTIRGQIMSWGGANLAGAKVTDGVDPAVVTDVNGRFIIRNVRAGATYTLTASDPGFNTRSTGGINIGYGSNSAATLSLMPSSVGTISGTVTSAASGAGISGATVTDAGGSSTATSVSGGYTLGGLTPGSHSLTAAAPGFATSPAQIVVVTAGQTTQTANFSLTPAVSGPPRLVQVAGASETAPSTSLTAKFSTATAAGHLLVLSAGLYAGAASPIAAVTDAGGNTWRRIGAYLAPGHFSDGELWYAADAIATTSVVIHTTGPVVAAMAVQEFSGVATTTPLDVFAGTSSVSTVAGSGAIAPTGSTDLVVGFVAGHNNAQAISVGPGYGTQAQQTSSNGLLTAATVVTGYKVLTSASVQAFSGSFAAPMYWSAGIATFRSAP